MSFNLRKKPDCGRPFGSDTEKYAHCHREELPFPGFNFDGAVKASDRLLAWQVLASITWTVSESL